MNIYKVTMRSGEVRSIVAATAAIARRLASEDATEEGLALLDSQPEIGRAIMADAPAGVSLYRKAGGS